MSIPKFTAEASLYRTNNRYRASSSEGGDLRLGESIVPAYYLGSEAQARCDEKLADCAADAALLSGLGLAGCAVGCVATGPFYPACYGGCYAGAVAAVSAAFGVCYGKAVLPGSKCCPKSCQTPNPFNPGQGCCDYDEACVDRNDRNSRDGCCPSNQVVCGGKCCAKGENCCGDTCCPPNYFCRDGFCSEFPSDFLPPNGDPPKPPINNCIFGGEPCGRKCCSPGLQCCNDGECRRSCIN